MKTTTSLIIGMLVGLTTNLLAGDWPAWNGPNQDFYAPITKGTLVTKGEDVTTLWVSEDSIPGARSDDARATEQNTTSGGYASPVLADGRLFLYYYIPSGDVLDKRFANDTRYVFKNGITKAKWAISTDEIIHCFDAKTGKTLWKTTYPNAGLNWGIGFNKGGPAVSPIVANGRVFAISTIGEILCVDAKTGKKLWQSPLKERYSLLSKLKEDCLKQETSPQFNRSFSGSPVASGDILLVPWLFIRVQNPYKIYTHDKGVAAFNMADGREIWSKECHMGGLALRWKTGSRDLIIVGNKYGTECLDLKTGESLWKTDAVFYPTTVQGDIMTATHGKDKEAIVAGYRLSLTGPTKIWELTGYHTFSSPVARGTHLFFANNQTLRMVERETGKVVHEASIAGWDGAFVGHGNLLLLQSDFVHGGAQCTVMQITDTGFTNLGKWPLGTDTSYTMPINPAMDDGLLYIRAPNRIKCLDLRAK